MEDVTARFAEVVAQPSDLLAIDEAVLLIAAHDHDLERDHELARLDELADRCRGGDLDRLRHLLFEDEGFRGADDDYHHPDNSFLDRVLDRRQGLPILLCVLTAEVAARSGICLAPVGLPGHFLLRDCGDDDVFVDPFAGGAILDPDDCVRIFRRLHAGQQFHDRYLEPIDNHAVLTRVVTNLVHTYSQRGPVSSLAWALHLRALLVGGDAWLHAARLRERTGDWRAAADAWTEAAAAGVGPDDVETRATRPEPAPTDVEDRRPGGHPDADDDRSRPV